MAVKRGPRKNPNKLHLAGNVRKRSAYSAFKKEFLASDKAKKLRDDGVAESEIQKQGSLEYRHLSPDSKEKYSSAAEVTNATLPESTHIPKEKIVKKIVGNIQKSMEQLDQLGCPSVWLGFNGRVPERLYSPELKDLGEDEIFTNYVVSTMVNKLALTKMKNACATNAAKKCKDKVGQARSKKLPTVETVTKSRSSNGNDQTIHQTKSKRNVEPQEQSLRIGDEVSLLNASGEKVGDGQVTNQDCVHGYKLREGFVPLMVLDVVPGVKAHHDYPTHSGLVEKNSFVAWPRKSVTSKKS